MSNDYVTTSYLDEKIAQLNKRFDDLFKKLDWFAGKYTKVDETQEIQAGKLSNLEERTEALEKNRRTVVQWQSMTTQSILVSFFFTSLSGVSLGV